MFFVAVRMNVVQLFELNGCSNVKGEALVRVSKVTVVLLMFAVELRVRLVAVL